jgi:hypothetical protein
MQDALQLRFSLVGGMFEFITCSYQSINDWGVLLVRLIVRGVIDLTNNADLYCTALDMITALIHSTLVIDREVGQISYFCTYDLYVMLLMRAASITRASGRRLGRCQHETVRNITILMYLNIPDFFIPCFSF